jgi:hypothetical protein
MCARVRNIADLSQRIEIEDADVPAWPGARNIQIASIGVCRHVVESTIASDHLNPENFVRASVLPMSENRKGKRSGESDCGERLANHSSSCWFAGRPAPERLRQE